MSSDSPQIRELKQRYKASFPEKVALFKSIKEMIITDADLNSAREELHKLAGSSGMYGYVDIAETCRDAMLQVDDGKISDVLVSFDKIIDSLEQSN